jgi:hypothetical protein
VFSFLVFRVKEKCFHFFLPSESFPLAPPLVRPKENVFSRDGTFKIKYFQPTKRFTKNSQFAFDFILQPVAEPRDEPWLKILYLWLCDGLGP